MNFQILKMFLEFIKLIFSSFQLNLVLIILNVHFHNFFIFKNQNLRVLRYLQKVNLAIFLANVKFIFSISMKLS